MTEVTEPIARRHSFLRRLARWLGIGVLALVMTGLVAWAALAVCFAALHGGAPRYLLGALLAILSLGAAILIRPRRYGLLAILALFAATLVWYFQLKPSNDLNWSPDVAKVAAAQVNGDVLTIHNVRNFDYRSESDFTRVWEDRSYDLSKLRSVDLALCYWGSKAIAHAIVSFGFDDGRWLAISIETRKETTESYSALQGFFRQYELIYVVADERDVLRLRTNYRKEDVYLYHTRTSPQSARAILMSYIGSINQLHDHPEFYNALTTNCATGVIPHARAARRSARVSWEILLSGYAARQAYQNGSLDDSMPFEQLESRSRVNDAAIAADADPQFSSRIRAGLPIPAPRAGEN